MTAVFTGVVEDLGSVESVDVLTDSTRMRIRGSVVPGSGIGDSICVNGVCLTATTIEDDIFTADVMRQTLQCSALEDLQPGDRVNLERAATLTTRLGGHVVQGHVDGVGQIVGRDPGEAWEVVTIRLPEGLTRYVVDKGSIALDGVSLTVAAVAGDAVTVSLIPETLRRTTWGGRRVGDRVNVEVDVLAKHVERLLAGRLEDT